MNRTTGRRSPAVLSLLVLSLALATAATAVAVDVRGTLQAAPDYGRAAPETDEERRRNHYWDEWNGFLDPAPQRFDAARELAVVLTGPGELAAEQPGFQIANGNLRPRTLVERVGQNLRIENTDPVVHRIYAEGLSDLSPMPTTPGLVRQQAVNQAGHWPLRDELYGHVRGHLHVLPDLIARARIQPDGSFVFSNVLPGPYTLAVFHGERQLHSAQVQVPADRELVVDPISITQAPAQAAPAQ